jgi:hypothetical protein
VCPGPTTARWRSASSRNADAQVGRFYQASGHQPARKGSPMPASQAAVSPGSAILCQGQAWTGRVTSAFRPGWLAGPGRVGRRPSSRPAGRRTHYPATPRRATLLRRAPGRRGGTWTAITNQQPSSILQAISGRFLSFLPYFLRAGLGNTVQNCVDVSNNNKKRYNNIYVIRHTFCAFCAFCAPLARESLFPRAAGGGAKSAKSRFVLLPQGLRRAQKARKK